MSKIYTEFLGKERKHVWDRLGAFSNVGVLGGGTALALQLNHRKSYDFDVFSVAPIEKSLLGMVARVFPRLEVMPLIDSSDELTVEVGSVKLTFLYYPFKHIAEPKSTESLQIFSVEDIAADKAYTIGRRGVWRDYYDLYSILSLGVHTLGDIVLLAKRKFKSLFNTKLFLEQLVYYADITDFSIEAVQGVPTEPLQVQNYLSTEVKDYLEAIPKS